MKKRITMLLLAIAMCLSCFVSCFFTTSLASASNIGVIGGYTSVLEDLQKDENFNAEDYPIVADDYSLQVITIAESENKELFIYVYQPSANYKDLRATSISMSTAYRTAKEFNIYYLDFVNSKDAFYKYVVKNFKVSDATTRSYEISEIFRKWDANLDAESGNDNTINEVTFAVGMQYTFTTNGENSSLIVENVDYIQIVEKLVGYVRYHGDKPAFISQAYNGCDSHFVAFSTDRNIDLLMEADIYYKTRSCEGRQTGYYDDWTIRYEYFYGEYTDSYSFLDKDDMFTYDGERFEYTRKRIQTVDEFIQSEKFDNEYTNLFVKVGQHNELTEQAQEDLKGKQWVLRFAETNYNLSLSADSYFEYSTEVSNVTILRLKFKTDGLVYDLGVVDNMQSGSGNPLNSTTYTYELADWMKILLTVLFLIIFIIVFAPLLPTIFSFVWLVIKVVFKIVIWVVSLPLKLINAIFKKRGKD